VRKVVFHGAYRELTLDVERGLEGPLRQEKARDAANTHPRYLGEDARAAFGARRARVALNFHALGVPLVTLTAGAGNIATGM
jgi:hypothetical protein